MKKIAFLAIFVLMLTALVACGDTGQASNQGSSNTVSMSGATFGVNSITISKGSTITFATDASGAPHNLVNGSNGQANIESGAPDFTSAGQTVAPGKSWTSPPWNTAGTFHVTCTYHPTTMTLTVTVQ